MSEFSKPKDIHEIDSMLADAWLNINVNESTLFNPMETIPTVWEDSPELYFAWLMSRPEYFSFVCKEVFNVQLLPMQSLILKELWDRKFPMLLATRGGGKSWLLGLYALLRITFMRQRKVIIVGAAFRQSKVIFEYMETIWNNAPVLRSMCPSNSGPKHEQDMWRFYIGDSVASALPLGCLSGDTLITTNNGITNFDDLKNNYNKDVYVWSDNQMRQTGFFFDNGIYDTKKIITSRGYNYTGTYNHRMKIVRNNKIQWCRTDEMIIGDYLLLDRSDRWFNPTFNCSTDEAYCLGAMIGDGSWINKYRLQFTNIDKECINLINKTIAKNKMKTYDNLHYYILGKKIRQDWLVFWNLEVSYTPNKKMPNSILSAGKYQVAACLSGLFDTDGSVQVQQAKGGVSCTVSFWNTSKKLVDQMQYILLHYGIMSTILYTDKKSPRTGNDCLRCYQILISGSDDVEMFSQKIGFRILRKQKLLDYYLNNRKRTHNINSNYIPVDKNLLIDIIKHKKLGHRFNIKDIEHRKNITFKYLERFLKRCSKRSNNHLNVKILQKLCNKDYYYDRIKFINDIKNIYTYDINVPYNNQYIANGFVSHNTGEKIRGQRANDILCDEFASVPREIFENVVAGFGAVSANPVESVIEMSSNLLAEKMGIIIKDDKDDMTFKSNQIILSGTAYYDFNHFAEYWRDWSNIIRTKGDPKKIQDFFNKKSGNKKIEKTEVPSDFNWKDYSVIRIPYELVPKGFLDAGQIARSKATIHTGIYMMEYGCCFSNDSNGFYKRSLIETCVGNPNQPISLPSGEVYFSAMIRGNPAMKYVYGIDPASEVDNFTIVIMETHPDHHRIVYVWSTTRKDHREKVKSKLIKETDFYSYCCRQIRDLMKKFPCVKIALDAQGGGIAVIEGLHDQDKIQVGELPIWPTIDLEKEKDTDGESGLHIVEMIQFASADWTSEANHGLRKDFEDKVTLFPHFDGLELSVAANKDALSGRLYDTLEDCMLDIEELKDELSTIIISETPSGREKWDTPEIKLPGNKKGRQRKDRYSSLLMANMVARQLVRDVVFQADITEGGFAGSVDVDDGIMYQGPAWFTEKVQGLY